MYGSPYKYGNNCDTPKNHEMNVLTGIHLLNNINLLYRIESTKTAVG